MQKWSIRKRSRRVSKPNFGKYFPTGSHKVGATFGPLVEKLVKGAFDPTKQEGIMKNIKFNKIGTQVP